MEKVKYVLLELYRNHQKVQSVFQPNEEKVSQSVVENVPKANVQSVSRPMVKLMPKANVQEVHFIFKLDILIKQLNINILDSQSQ